MATKLNLKQRSTRDTLTLPFLLLKGIVERGDKEALWRVFEGLGEDTVVHDKHWLEVIINWTPDGGLPLTETAKWFKLADHVSELDVDREGEMTLSDYQVDLIWKRLTSPQFKMDRLPLPFMGFVRDFQKATGRRFREEELDDES
jgi:hypothetical protein